MCINLNSERIVLPGPVCFVLLVDNAHREDLLGLPVICVVNKSFSGQ